MVFGFEPFSEYFENPSSLVADRLSKKRILGLRVIGKTLPVDFRTIEQTMLDIIEPVRTELILGVGLAPGRNSISLEKVALNYRLGSEKDNSGHLAPGAKVDARGPDALMSNLPVEEIVNRLREQGIPAKLSLSAGNYLCNQCMYIVIREALKRNCLGGFVHLPAHERLAAKLSRDLPSMSLATMEDAVRKVILLSLRFRARSLEPENSRT